MKEETVFRQIVPEEGAEKGKTWNDKNAADTGFLRDVGRGILDDVPAGPVCIWK